MMRIGRCGFPPDAAMWLCDVVTHSHSPLDALDDSMLNRDRVSHQYSEHLIGCFECDTNALNSTVSLGASFGFPPVA